MSLTEQTRLRLHQFLEERMGHDLATEIMAWLPRGDLATKADIEDLRLATKADIEALRLATKADIEAFRLATKADLEAFRLATKADLEAFRLATKADIEGLRAEMKSEVALVRAEITISSERDRADFHNTLRLHTIVLVGALGTMISIARIF